MKKDQEFYVGQKAFIKKDGKVLVLKLSDIDTIDFPGGKIQEGEENFIESLKREVKEETNLEVEIHEPFYTWYFTFHDKHPEAGKKVFLVGYRCTYVSGELTLSHEHSSFEWVDSSSYQKVNDKTKHFSALDYYFQSIK